MTGDPYRFKIADAWEGEEIDLFGHIYTVMAVTKSLAPKVDAAGVKIDQATGLAEKVPAIAAYFDIILKPVGDESAKPSAVIKKAWAADEIGTPALLRAYQYVAEASAVPPM